MRAGRLPDDHDPRRPVVGLPPSRRSCSADTREPPDQAGPGSSRCHTRTPRRRGASGRPRVWPRKATLRSTASAPRGATAPGLLSPPGSSPPQSHPSPTGRRRRPGGRSCLPVLRQQPLPRCVTPAPGRGLSDGPTGPGGPIRPGLARLSVAPPPPAPPWRLHSRTARPRRAPPVPAATCAAATPHLVTRHTAIRHRLGHLLCAWSRGGVEGTPAGAQTLGDRASGCATGTQLVTTKPANCKRAEGRREQRATESLRRHHGPAGARAHRDRAPRGRHREAGTARFSAALLMRARRTLRRPGERHRAGGLHTRSHALTRAYMHSHTLTCSHTHKQQLFIYSFSYSYTLYFFNNIFRSKQS